MNTLSSLLPFLKGGDEISKKLGRGTILKKSVWETKGKGRGNSKIIGRCDVFIFVFSLFAMMETNTVFRKSSLENLF